MLGFSNKKEAKVRFEEEVSNYDSNLIDLNRKIDWLHFEKGKTYSVLKDVEAYLNTLKNTPEEIVKEFNSAKLQISTYEKELDLIKKELDKIESSSFWSKNCCRRCSSWDNCSRLCTECGYSSSNNIWNCFYGNSHFNFIWSCCN